MSKKVVEFEINVGGNGVVNIDKLNVSVQKAASGFDKLLVGDIQSMLLLRHCMSGYLKKVQYILDFF
ncbi:MAG: hypothetical protein LBG92_12390 [Prevotellaceae bacterium]|jgi:hypothetical protein|nr:hypothetical protein [Prevotellaceae bacterium]